MTGKMTYLGAEPARGPMSLARASGDWFGLKASTYDDDREDDPKWLAENAGVEKFLGMTQGAVLDVPCGTGRYFGVYEDLGRSYVGYDISEEMLAIAKEKYPEAKASRASVTEIPEKDRSFPTTVCIRLLEKLREEEMVKVIGELCRVTDQTLIFNAITGKELQARNRAWRHRQEVLEQALVQNGFRLVDAHPVRDPEYYVWMARRVTG